VPQLGALGSLIYCRYKSTVDSHKSIVDRQPAVLHLDYDFLGSDDVTSLSAFYQGDRGN
jgi:hypothetical protein